MIVEDEHDFNLNTVDEIKNYLRKVDHNNIKDISRALLISYCLFDNIDPILIEEIWICKVVNFLKELAEIKGNIMYKEDM